MFNKNHFRADNYFIKNLAFLRNPFFFYSTAYYHQPVYLGLKHAQSPCELNTKTFWQLWLFFLSLLPFYLDHEKFGKCTTGYTQAFTKTLTIVRVTWIFLGNYECRFFKWRTIAAIFLTVDQLWLKNKKYKWRTWATVSFHIAMPVEYNPVLLVVIFMAEKLFSMLILSESYYQIIQHTFPEEWWWW